MVDPFDAAEAAIADEIHFAHMRGFVLGAAAAAGIAVVVFVLVLPWL